MLRTCLARAEGDTCDRFHIVPQSSCRYVCLTRFQTSGNFPPDGLRLSSGVMSSALPLARGVVTLAFVFPVWRASRLLHEDDMYRHTCHQHHHQHHHLLEFLRRQGLVHTCEPAQTVLRGASFPSPPKEILTFRLQSSRRALHGPRAQLAIRLPSFLPSNTC